MLTVRMPRLNWMRMFGHALLITISCSIITTFLTQKAVAAPPTYKPEVGKAYEYGIELWTVSKVANRYETRERCRIEYRITEANDTQWTADYSITPLGFNGPLPRRLPNAVADPTRADIIPSIAGNRQASIAAEIRSLVQEQENRRKQFPGLYGHVDGVIQFKNNGELIADSQSSFMPLPADEASLVPIIRLPTEETTPSYSYKTILKIVAISGGKELETQLSMINSLKPKVSTDASLFSIERRVELAGGASVQSILRASGNGNWEFSLGDSMPASGSIDIELIGKTRADGASESNVRISFQRLCDWQKQLFDLNLLPTAEALSEKHLPRLTALQIKELDKYFRGEDRMSVSNQQFNLMRFAPPPPNSKIANSVRDLAEKAAAQLKTASAGRLTSLYVDVVAIHKRWEMVYVVSTKIPRKWSDTSKTFSVEARLVDRIETTVRLQRVDNSRMVEISLDRLCSEDQGFVNSFAVIQPIP